MSYRKRNKDTGRLFGSKVCAFCGQVDDNEIIYGKLIVGDDITVHTNCMFFASGLGQEGDENEGVFGFLMPDIEAELRRGKKLFCSYCRKRGATVGCCIDSCKKSFHLNCGIEHGSLHQFFGSFCSFCQDHKPKQKKVTIVEDLYCYICCEEISSDELNSCLYPPCCKKNLFHKTCIQKYALSAGLYFFKCPLCNNSKEFVKEMEIYGICIPEKDASWELEENAYQELLCKPECDAAVCLCSKGRKYCSQRKSGWTLMSCSHCGYHARHKKCGNIKLGVRCWICEECKILQEEIEKKKKSAQTVEHSTSSEIEGKSSNPVTQSVPSSSHLCFSPSLILEDCLNTKNSLQVDMCFIPSENDLKNHEAEGQNAPSSSHLCYSPSLILQDCFNINSLQADMHNVSLSGSLYNDNNIFHDVCEKDSSMADSKDLEKVEASESDESVHDTTNNSSNYVPDNNTTVYKLGSLAVNLNESNFLKDIKNFAHNSVTKRLHDGSKIRDSKKNVKKQKVSSTCCKSHNQICIKKYFGQNCGKYRL